MAASGKGNTPGSSTYKQFVRRHLDLFAEVQNEPYFVPSSGMTSLSESIRDALLGISPKADRNQEAADLFRSWSVVRLLRVAVTENCKEAIDDLLGYLLFRLGVYVPGSIVIEQTGQAGRPVEQIGVEIHSGWVAAGRPLLTPKRLTCFAHVFYPEECSTATASSDTQTLRKLRERVRSTIRRHEQNALARESGLIS